MTNINIRLREKGEIERERERGGGGTESVRQTDRQTDARKDARSLYLCGNERKRENDNNTTTAIGSP